MDVKRIVDIVLLALAVVGAIYYSASDNESQGIIVLLLAILYFIVFPHRVKT